MLVNEVYINATENYQFGESGAQPTDYSPSEVYRNCQREFGRCMSKVYVDAPGGPIPHGWVFHSRQRYEDCNETYLREVWVILLTDEGKPFDLRKKARASA